MLLHYIPLPHRFLQSWMKLSKCAIQTPIRPDISGPLTGFQISWLHMFGLRPEHVWVSEGIGLPIYRPIYRLGRPIFNRFQPVFTRRRRFLGRSTRRRAPHPIPGRIWQLFTPALRVSSTAYPPLRLARFIGSAADYCLIPGSFHPTAADFGPTGPASAPLSTEANGE
jgi:hypothetical protein